MKETHDADRATASGHVEGQHGLADALFVVLAGRVLLSSVTRVQRPPATPAQRATPRLRSFSPAAGRSARSRR
jgi:hypothetical protein